MSLATCAAAALRAMPPPRSLEELFYSAALRTLAEGRLSDPPIAEVRALARPDRLWEGLPPHSDYYAERVARLADTTLLALALGAEAWLVELAVGWETVGDVEAMRARG